MYRVHSISVLDDVQVTIHVNRVCVADCAGGDGASAHPAGGWAVPLACPVQPCGGSSGSSTAGTAQQGGWVTGMLRLYSLGRRQAQNKAAVAAAVAVAAAQQALLMVRVTRV